jgi:tRNA-specific 2-thiouridylase
MVTPEGVDMGEHQGLMFYTLGQRQGLGIGGVKDASDEPWFSLQKDLENNILIVGQGTEHPLLYNDNLSASAIHWINGAPANGNLNCYAKTRYRQPDQQCNLTLDDAGNGHVIFDQPQRAITPGQSVVFYLDDQCLGGGVIDKAWQS